MMRTMDKFQLALAATVAIGVTAGVAVGIARGIEAVRMWGPTVRPTVIAIGILIAVGGTVWVGFKLYDAITRRVRDVQDRRIYLESSYDTLARDREYHSIQLEHEKNMLVYPDSHGLLGAVYNVQTRQAIDLDNITPGMKHAVGRQRQLAGLTGSTIHYQAVENLMRGGETEFPALQSDIRMMPQHSVEESIEV